VDERKAGNAAMAAAAMVHGCVCVQLIHIIRTHTYTCVQRNVLTCTRVCVCWCALYNSRRRCRRRRRRSLHGPRPVAAEWLLRAARRARGARGVTGRASAAGWYTFGVCDVHLTVNSVRLEKINDCRLIYTCVGRLTHVHTHTTHTHTHTYANTYA